MRKKQKNRTAIYARVSTLDQDPEMQIRELRVYARHRGLTIAEEFIDRVSGLRDDRPQLARLWQQVHARKIDTVIVWKFDRFARSTKQLIDALEEFKHLGVDFISITEQIDTSSPMGKAMFTVISAIAEFERSLISERVRAGIAKARAQGKRHGRPPVDERVAKEIRRLRKQKKSLSVIAKQLGVSRQTVANYTKRRSRIQ
ncbi:MAG: recombinase family protein [Acidobacteria bacterium]|nr:recombinase family protein [Acidobacteriota bacterium]